MKNHSFLYIVLFFGLLIYPAIVGNTNNNLENKIELVEVRPDSIKILIEDIRKTYNLTVKQQDTLRIQQNLIFYAKKPD